MASKTRNLRRGESHKDERGFDIICCHCGCERVSKQGKTKFDVQQYYCQDCKKIFSTNTERYLNMLNLSIDRRRKIERKKTMWMVFNMSLLSNLEDFKHEQWAW